MKAKPVRVVLAFYPADEGPAENTRKSLRNLARVCVVRHDSEDNDTPASCRRYALLRLEGEAMLVAETPPWKVERVVNILQSAGSPAIFVVRPNFEVSAEFKGAASADAPGLKRNALTRRAILDSLARYKLAL